MNVASNTQDQHFGIPGEFMTGAFAPVFEEMTAWNLSVEGEIPAVLNGLYVRNGANPPPIPYEGPYHWFVPDGMLHGVRFQAGKALWYRNRWVRTDELANKIAVKPVPGPRETGYAPNTSNTALVAHAGRLLSLAEYGLPYEVDSELDTVQRWDFDGRLNSTMTAHPKIDPESGLMFFISNPPMPPFATVHTVGTDGRLFRSEPMEVRGPSLMHDMAITRNFVVLFDLPVIFDPAALMETSFPYRWNDDYGARIGLLPKSGSARDMRWFDIEPGYFVHVLNAYEDGDEVVVDAPYYGKVLQRGNNDPLRQGKNPELRQWRLNLKDGSVRQHRLSDLAFEFPMLNPQRIGRPYRYAYGVTTRVNADSTTGFVQLLKYDLHTGAADLHDVAGGVPSEALFVPKPGGAGEDEGWLLSYVYRPERDASDLIVVDASRFSQAPVAVIHLPQRVPNGFHGTWMPA